MQRCPTSTASEVALLRADSIEPTLDELAALMHWGALVECPRGRVGPQPEDAPIEVGDRVLWPLTMQAESWIDAMGASLPRELLTAAYGLAAERSREPGAFEALYKRSAAIHAVRQWAANLPATADQLVRALEQLGPELSPADSEPADPADEPPILPPAYDTADLVAATGLPAEYWATHTSRHYVAVMRAIVAEHAAEAGSKSPRDPSAEAYRQLLILVGQIRRRAAPSQPKS